MSEQEHPALYVDRGPVEEEWIEQARWPKVIGIISVVWGSLNVACIGCGVGMQFMMGGMLQTVYPDGMPLVMLSPPLINYVSGAVSAAAALLLILCGVMLLLRNPVARPLHLMYAVIALLATAFGMYLQIEVQAELAQWAKDNPGTAFAKQQANSGTIGAFIGVIVTALFGVWPLFCLIWFGAVKRNSSEIARGASAVV